MLFFSFELTRKCQRKKQGRNYIQSAAHFVHYLMGCQKVFNILQGQFKHLLGG